MFTLVHFRQLNTILTENAQFQTICLYTRAFSQRLEVFLTQCGREDIASGMTGWKVFLPNMVKRHCIMCRYDGLEGFLTQFGRLKTLHQVWRFGRISYPIYICGSSREDIASGLEWIIYPMYWKGRHCIRYGRISYPCRREDIASETGCIALERTQAHLLITDEQNLMLQNR